jgi:hypothetical protein
MDEELANEAIQELSDVWYKYSDAFENPVYASYVLWHLNKAQKLIWDEITEQKTKERDII